MGNAKSISSNNSKLATEIDRIASNYILSLTFDDMNKLSEKDHCDKLVLLTAKIINKNLNPLEQKEVVKRIDGGILPLTPSVFLRLKKMLPLMLNRLKKMLPLILNRLKKMLPLILNRLKMMLLLLM